MRSEIKRPDDAKPGPEVEPEVDVAGCAGSLPGAPRPQHRFELDDLLKGARPENLHAEVSSGLPVGLEFW